MPVSFPGKYCIYWYCTSCLSAYVQYYYVFYAQQVLYYIFLSSWILNEKNKDDDFNVSELKMSQRKVLLEFFFTISSFLAAV